MVKLETSGSFHMFSWSKTFLRQFSALVSQDETLYIIPWPVVFWPSFKPMWAGVCAQRRELLLPSQTCCGGRHTMLRGPQRRLCGGSLQSTCKLTTAQNHTHKQFILTPLCLLKGGEPWGDCGFWGSLSSCHLCPSGHLQVIYVQFYACVISVCM